MGIPFTLPMGFLFTVTMGILLTIALAIQLTISSNRHPGIAVAEQGLREYPEDRKLIISGRPLFPLRFPPKYVRPVQSHP
jgi:hypothetical protein